MCDIFIQLDVKINKRKELEDNRTIHLLHILAKRSDISFRFTADPNDGHSLIMELRQFIHSSKFGTNVKDNRKEVPGENARQIGYSTIAPSSEPIYLLQLTLRIQTACSFNLEKGYLPNPAPAVSSFINFLESAKQHIVIQTFNVPPKTSNPSTRLYTNMSINSRWKTSHNSLVQSINGTRGQKRLGPS